jgi:hypothetical protein
MTQAGGEEAAQRDRVDLRPGEEGQQDAADAGEERDPVRRCHAEEIAAHDADEDLDERDGQPDPGDGARQERQADPERGDSVAGVEAVEEARVDRTAAHGRTPTRFSW